MPSPAAIDFDTVRKMGLALPGVEYSSTRDAPALKAHGKLLAWMPVKRSVEPGTLALRIEFDDRAELLAASPDVYYLTDHYVEYNAVLVRLSRINTDELKDLLGMAYKFVTRQAAPHRPARKQAAPKRRRDVL